MTYVLQLAVLIFGIASERYVTKWANQKIADKAPYTSGVFVAHPLTGEKAIFMYKTNITVTRVVLILLVISIITIDTIP